MFHVQSVFPLYSSHKLSYDETLAFLFKIKFMRLFNCGLIFAIYIGQPYGAPWCVRVLVMHHGVCMCWWLFFSSCIMHLFSNLMIGACDAIQQNHWLFCWYTDIRPINECFFFAFYILWWWSLQSMTLEKRYGDCFYFSVCDFSNVFQYAYFLHIYTPYALCISQ